MEFLALKWKVTKRFHEYLYGNNFAIYTDNNLLTYTLTKAKLDATGHRWVAALVAYNFTLNYRLGKINVDVDALSRNPLDREQAVDPGTMRHLLGTVITKAGCVIECYTGHTATMPEPVPKMEPSKMCVTDWMEAHREVEGIRKIMSYMKPRS